MTFVLLVVLRTSISSYRLFGFPIRTKYGRTDANVFISPFGPTMSREIGIENTKSTEYERQSFYIAYRYITIYYQRTQLLANRFLEIMFTEKT